MARQQAWERFDASFNDLDEGSAEPNMYIATVWDGGMPAAFITANEACDKLSVLDPRDLAGKLAANDVIVTE